MSEKEKNRIVVLEPSTSNVQELLRIFEQKGFAEIVQTSSPDEAVQLAQQFLPCMLVMSFRDNNEVPGRIQILKKLENSARHHGLKTLVVSTLKNPRLGELVTQKLGVTDFIEEPAPLRTMQFKANLQLKAIDNFRRQLEIKKSSQEKVVIKNLNQKKNDAGNVNGKDLLAKQKPALGVKEDTFLFKNSGLKKTGKKVIAELEGPDPETGDWVQHEDKGNAAAAWRWVPKEEKEAQDANQTPKDGWVHKGDKPVFNETRKKWQFVSETPELALHKDGEKVAEKIGTDEKGEVFVAEDSPEAEENLKKNQAKIDKIKRAKGKDGTKEMVFGDKISEEEVATSLGAEAKVDDDKKKLTPLEKRRKKSKDDLQKKLSEGLEEETPEGERRSDANKENVVPILERRKVDGTLEEAEEDTAVVSKAVEAKAAEKGLSALEFLKRKKEQGKNSGAITKEEEEKEATEAKEQNPGEEQKERKKPAAIDKLGRLKQIMDNGTELLSGEEEEQAIEPEANLSDEGIEETDLEKLALRKQQRENARRQGSAPKRPKNKLETAEENLLRQERAKKAKDNKRDLLKELQDKLKEPLPETLPAEEEEQLRAELGLQDRPDLNAKDLVKKKRLETVKKQKQRLLELDHEVAELGKDPEPNVHDLSEDEQANHGSIGGNLSADELKGITGHSDGELEEEKEESAAAKLKRRVTQSEERDRNLFEDKSQYMPEADIHPLGNAWEATAEHFVYLDGQTRYRGFEKLDELLPLWIFAGANVPEMLDKTRQWRFRGSLPCQAKTLVDVPKDVRDFLIALRDQIRKDKAKEKEDGASASDAFDEEHEKKESEGAEEDEISKERRMRKEKVAERQEHLCDEVAKEEIEDGSSAPLARSRTQLEAGSDLLEEANGAATNTKEDLDDLAKKTGVPLENFQSEGMQKFLERRTKKKELAEGEDFSAQKNQKMPVIEEELRRAFLGIFVSLSDSFVPGNEASLGLSRVLQALESSFDGCTAVVTELPKEDGQATVRARSIKPKESAEKVLLSAGLALPISQSGSENAALLGYLWLKVLAPKKELRADEIAAAKKVAEGIWPLIVQMNESQGNAKVAA